MSRTRAVREPRRSGPGGVGPGRETTLLELASALDAAIQDETLACYLLAALIRTGALRRRSDGLVLEIAAGAEARAYAMGADREEGIAAPVRREIPAGNGAAGELRPRTASVRRRRVGAALDQQGGRA